MSAKSILLELDGSAQSRYAAELVWSMARANNMSVNAQYVVDSLATWDFLNFDLAGFIGSEPFFDVHQMMLDSLTNVGKDLIEAYSAQAAGHEIKGGTFLDEGTTIREVCFRAKAHEIVAIGQRSTGMSSPEEDKRRLPRRSVAETLTYYCPRPLLVVQDRCDSWKKMKIVLSTEKMPPELLKSCLDFAASINAEPEIRFVFVDNKMSEVKKAAKVDSHPEAKQLLAELSKSVPAVAKAKVEMHLTNNLHSYWKQDAEDEANSLLVVPVNEVDGLRKTSFGTSPDTVVRYLNHSAVFFWMEEQPVVEPAKVKAASSAV